MVIFIFLSKYFFGILGFKLDKLLVDFNCWAEIDVRKKLGHWPIWSPVGPIGPTGPDRPEWDRTARFH